MFYKITTDVSRAYIQKCINKLKGGILTLIEYKLINNYKCEIFDPFFYVISRTFIYNENASFDSQLKMVFNILLPEYKKEELQDLLNIIKNFMYSMNMYDIKGKMTIYKERITALGLLLYNDDQFEHQSPTPDEQ